MVDVLNAFTSLILGLYKAKKAVAFVATVLYFSTVIITGMLVIYLWARFGFTPVE